MRSYSTSPNPTDSEQIKPVECARELKEWGIYDRLVSAFRGAFTLGTVDAQQLNQGQLRFSFEGRVSSSELSISGVYFVVTRQGEWGTLPDENGDCWKIKLKRDGDSFLIGDQQFSKEEVTKIKQLLLEGYRAQRGSRLASDLDPLRFPVGKQRSGQGSDAA